MHSEIDSSQVQTQSFFKRTITEAGSGVSPRNENALEVGRPSMVWLLLIDRELSRLSERCVQQALHES